MTDAERTALLVKIAGNKITDTGKAIEMAKAQIELLEELNKLDRLDAERTTEEMLDEIVQKLQKHAVVATIEDVCQYVEKKYSLVWLSADLRHHYNLKADK